MDKIAATITNKLCRDDLKLLITEDGAWKTFVVQAALSRLPAFCTQHFPPDHEHEGFLGRHTLGWGCGHSFSTIQEECFHYFIPGGHHLRLTEDVALGTGTVSFIYKFCDLGKLNSTS